jgi:hypothetical protein
MLTMSGLRFASWLSARHMTSDAVVAPPGLSMRSTTLLTVGSSRSSLTVSTTE